VVPAAVLLNAIDGAEPLHTAVAEGVAVSEGVGFTLTVAVAEAVQLLAEPIIV
jgi:hypothetical protein